MRIRVSPVIGKWKKKIIKKKKTKKIEEHGNLKRKKKIYDNCKIVKNPGKRNKSGKGR